MRLPATLALPRNLYPAILPHTCSQHMPCSLADLFAAAYVNDQCLRSVSFTRWLAAFGRRQIPTHGVATFKRGGRVGLNAAAHTRAWRRAGLDKDNTHQAAPYQDARSEAERENSCDVNHRATRSSL